MRVAVKVEVCRADRGPLVGRAEDGRLGTEFLLIETCGERCRFIVACMYISLLRFNDIAATDDFFFKVDRFVQPLFGRCFNTRGSLYCSSSVII